MLSRLARLARMALADLVDEWPVSVAVTLAIAAVAAPLLVLLGLREGVIGELFARLRADPAIRLVTLDATGAARFDPAWFAAARSWPETGFLLPATRFAAAQADFRKLEGDGAEERASLLPTADGDPVFPAGVPPLPTSFHVRLSAELAARLGVGQGERIAAAVERRVAGGRLEPLDLVLTVAGIAPPAAFAGRAAFARPELLIELEDFRDGFAAPLLGVATGAPRGPRPSFPNWRLYATGLEDVAPLLARLRDNFKLSVSGQEARIAAALNLDANLAAVMRGLVLLGGAGLVGGLAAIQWSMAARKRRTVAILALMGFGRFWLMGLPIAQAVMLALAGAAVTIILAYAFGFWINAELAASLGASGAACVYPAALLGSAVLALVAVSVLPALRIGARHAKLEPANEIRES